MIATINTLSIYGIEALPVKVEVQVARGLHRQITGLPDQIIRETIDRMPDILSNLGYKMPRTRLTIHLSPASVPKKGNAFDLPILLGILMASEQIIDLEKSKQYVFAGEVTLDGSIKPVRGALCMAQKAKQLGYKGIVLPVQNSQEAALIDGMYIYGVQQAQEVIAFILSDSAVQPFKRNSARTNPDAQMQLDFKDVIGQHNLKRAMEIAAAGGHHTLMVGPPGCGKSLVAKRLSSILPPMSREEMLETTRIYSVSQQTVSRLVTQRPFRTIHHTISEVGLAGGGPEASPGEITLAHNGVLFMDELAEFKPAALEALRQPLEDRTITVARNKAIIQYPASFMLIAAMNPCLCGYFNHPTRKCTCSKRALYWYRRKISGPLVDRFDLQVQAEPIAAYEFNQAQPSENSATIRERVRKARYIQTKRYGDLQGIYGNAQMPDNELAVHCTLEKHDKRFLLDRLEKLQLSARAYSKILKVARTIADLAGKSNIELAHIAEAIHFRALDHPLIPSTNITTAILPAKLNGHEHFI